MALSVVRTSSCSVPKLVVIDMDHFGLTSSHPPPPYDYCILDEEAKKPLLLLPSEDAYGGDPIADYKDIDVVAVEPEREELASEVAEILVYEAEEQEEETIKSVKEADQDGDVLVEAAAPDGVSQCAREEEEEEEEEEGVSKTGFGMGSLRVNGVGALCSFGVAAATFCILLLGGKQQQLHKRQGHKIQLQHMYADDERIQQVVQQASWLNQTMSSVTGGASSARASISFGGYYQGF
ncbi:unnamed protein product [Miscanthus lutarioriparius]|uniref:DUF6821 domain-containing protein n=1 Tax=Miscanthus lutarioriparius TaxID=422564 RepID=A0A811MU41_9POAL|nr:unnamed protein product [Miscanthus lutarioriparius]